MNEFKQYYEEAMIASNKAGFSGMSAAQTIEAMDTEISELRARLTEVNNWIVCACIATPEDMMQSAIHIENITNLTKAYTPKDTHE